MHYVYHCLEGDTVSIFTNPGRVLLYAPYAGRAAFTPDQYTGFIQREFIRLVESGAIPKPPEFDKGLSQAEKVAMIKEVREITGGGLFTVKNALLVSAWDKDKAIDYMRGNW